VLFIFFLSSCYDFFAVYLSLEGLGLTLYVLASMFNSSYCCLEASLKYFCLGGASSGISLFGVS